MATKKKPKAKPPRSREVVEKAIAAATLSLGRMDRRLARLSTIKGRLEAAANQTERRRAINNESINEWIAEFREDSEGTSDGIDFESLGVDLLILDEAQNMKNLWPVERREGGVPKYLGAISEGSNRAMSFALRAFLTQRFTGGSGVILLSATPAKNSPLEFYTLLQFVDHYCWVKRGINNNDDFIDRYLRLEIRPILKPDGTIESRSAVVGFMILYELRDIVFRFGDFKDAKDVGLVMPETRRHQVFIPMNEEQRSKYQRYRTEYEKIITSRDFKERYRALAILSAMGMVALHPELDQPPVTRSRSGSVKEKRGWTWNNAKDFVHPASPKLTRAVEIVMQKPLCGHIIFCDPVGIHRVLRDLLVAAGVDPSRIAVLNADRAPKPLQRQEIADGFNGQPAIIDPETGRVEQEAVEPIYDIVIANAVAYEGIDLQVRTCDVIHLDLPMEPATLQQRNGRAVRQGNMQSVVDIYYLLSEKSYDAIKLGLITGKLRWMSDILKGADRETNNPAAGMDLSVEDMLLMLADDPEAAKAALAAIKLRADVERRENASKRAWQRLGNLISYLRMAVSREDELEREQARKQALDEVIYLRSVPSDLWPWLWVVEQVLAGVPTTTISVSTAESTGAVVMKSRPIWDGLYLEIGPGRGLHFAAVTAGGYSYRVDGGHVWERPKYGMLPKLDALVMGQSPPEAFRLSPPDDSPRWRKTLTDSIGKSAWSSDLAWLGLFAAPDAWRATVWVDYGAAVVAAIGRNSEMPTRSGDTVVFASGGSVAEVIPPTDAGFAELLGRISNGRHRYAKANEVALAWWGREFPRGFVDDRELVSLSVAGAPATLLRIEPGAQAGFVAAETAPRRWQVGHGPTQAVWGPAMADMDMAKLGVRAMASLAASNGLTADQPVTPTDKQLALLDWLSEQGDLPTLSGVLEHYAQQ